MTTEQIPVKYPLDASTYQIVAATSIERNITQGKALAQIVEEWDSLRLKDAETNKTIISTLRNLNTELNALAKRISSMEGQLTDSFSEIP